MKLFLDTANLEEIRTIKKWGVLAGCTTNPSLLAKEHADWEVQMKEVCAEVDGPVSLETTSTGADDLYEEGLRLAGVAPNAVVKVAMTSDGLEAGKRLPSWPPRSGPRTCPRSSAGSTTWGLTGCTHFGRFVRYLRSRATTRWSWPHPSATPCTWSRPPEPERTWRRCRSACSLNS